MTSQPTVRTCLWFDRGGGEAARFYVSLIPDSHVETGFDAGSDEPLIVDFSLAGAPFRILNGGPVHKLSEAVSISVLTKDQAETDRLWSALTAGGGEAGRCGWLRDRWGVSWQIVPEALPRLLGARDRAAAGRAQEAMMKMTRIEIETLEAAFRGAGVKSAD